MALYTQQSWDQIEKSNRALEDFCKANLKKKGFLKIKQ
jgi:hypothetical protein